MVEIDEDVYSRIQLLAKIPGSRVLCIGDVMLDRYVYGTIDRISPEAPIPVLQQRKQTIMPGGVGNVARNLMALGARVTMLAVLGADDAAEELRDLFTASGIDARFAVDPTRPTTVKTRFVAGQQQMLRLDVEDKTTIGADVAKHLWLELERALPEAQAVIVSDYAKGCLTPWLLQQLIQTAKQKRIPVLVDPKGDDYTRYAGATLLAPNLRELAEGAKRSVATDADIAAAAQFLQKQCRLDAVLVTRSQDGMTLCEAQQISHFPAQAREVYDVSGAGDTVLATLGAAVAAGASLQDAAALANIAGGIVVGKLGTASVALAELDEALLQSSGAMAKKLSSLSGLLDRIQLWRQQGQRIGFTNGCFDLIHPGHISLLRQARAACDRLIVALNTDASVQRLKGPSRPIQNQQSRATVMSSIDAVDAVVLFDADTPMDLIHAIRPDVLVKGADYTVQTVVGAEFVQSYGGKILLADIVQGQSTTSAVKKIKAG
jgi:D-beta-D-heptose 7-phosphate kinase/D-beta-D-heptose 1-phosphate adenosyltransferase